jgi:hypothetical protein
MSNVKDPYGKLYSGKNREEDERALKCKQIKKKNKEKVYINSRPPG